MEIRRDMMVTERFANTLDYYLHLSTEHKSELFEEIHKYISLSLDDYIWPRIIYRPLKVFMSMMVLSAEDTKVEHRLPWLLSRQSYEQWFAKYCSFLPLELVRIIWAYTIELTTEVCVAHLCCVKCPKCHLSDLYRALQVKSKVEIEWPLTKTKYLKQENKETHQIKKALWIEPLTSQRKIVAILFAQGFWTLISKAHRFEAEKSFESCGEDLGKEIILPMDFYLWIQTECGFHEKHVFCAPLQQIHLPDVIWCLCFGGNKNNVTLHRQWFESKISIKGIL